ncbi:MAG: type II toxin-antitoxin system HicB family antitoxin [Candidatus Marinimicrobia bacterium]|nr:type II toxin-antitoxin system HicB family antitoxin [Candidatus Neomarinimicrobiota bacterium]
MNQKTFTAVIHKEEDMYVADCPEVETVSQGETIEIAVANLREATELYLEEFEPPIHGQPVVTTISIAP